MHARPDRLTASVSPLIEVVAAFQIPVPAHIRVLNERSDVVIDEEAKLSDWVWSGALSEPDRSFVYRRGKSQDTPIGGGSVRVEAVEKRADEGWGSYFVPRREGTYRLEVSFAAADNAEEYSVQVVGHGGERLWL